jgi:hypothetical protein
MQPVTSCRTLLLNAIAAAMIVAPQLGTALAQEGLSEALAADAGAAAKSRIDCWIGAKFGDQPGQLIRGWICERRNYPATEAFQVSATAEPRSPSADKQDLATIGAGTASR